MAEKRVTNGDRLKARCCMQQWPAGRLQLLVNEPLPTECNQAMNPSRCSRLHTTHASSTIRTSDATTHHDHRYDRCPVSNSTQPLPHRCDAEVLWWQTELVDWMDERVVISEESFVRRYIRNYNRSEVETLHTGMKYSTTVMPMATFDIDWYSKRR